MRPQASPAREGEPSSALILVLAFATGALVANLYYAQPLIAAIGPDLGLKPAMAGAVVGATQIGYGIGLFLIVSLADLVESRRLVLATLGLTTIGLVGAALSTSAAPFFVAATMIGLFSTGAQVLLPFVAHLASDARRGRVIGKVMAGLLSGIMLSRPLALFVAASFGWRAVFWTSTALMLGVGALLLRMMPRYRPRAGMHYGQILASTAGMLVRFPAVRWRALYQALMFMAFNLFWTTAPLMLAQRLHLGAREIGLFALAGAGGALAAPIAGKLADHGRGELITGAAMVSLGAAFLATGWAAAAGSVALLVVLAVVIDAAVQTCQITGQRIIFAVQPEMRGRVNAIYMTLVFVGGALGSFLGAWIYAAGGWPSVAIAGGLIGAALIAAFALQHLTAGKRPNLAELVKSRRA
jgi:predicted MFS family arabinose efflux permease